jgi:diguanylate cyclase (GGDEF)-like protein
VVASFMLDVLVAPVRQGLPSGSRFALLEGGRLIHGAGDVTGTAVPVDLAGRTLTLRVAAPLAMAGLGAAAGLLGGGMVIIGAIAPLFVQGNRREDESRRATDEQAALRRVATAAAARPEDVALLIAREAALLVGADLGLVCRFDDRTARTVGSWGDQRGLALGAVPLVGEGVLARVSRSGAAARVEDYATLPPGDPVAGSEWARRMVGAVGAPVRVGETTWGAVLVAHGSRRPWPADTEERLGRFADLAAAAIASAEARRDLALQATTDPLTGLANRRTFEERLDAETARALRTGGPLALALIDIDHFKRVNDRFGHQAGDRVLIEMAERLTSIARPQDLVARIGGEEIAWLMGDTDVDGAHEAAERARRRVAGEPFEGVGRVTVSGGVCDLDRAPRAGGLVRGADLALYRAKDGGRDAIARAPRVIHAAETGPTPAGAPS